MRAALRPAARCAAFLSPCAPRRSLLYLWELVMVVLPQVGLFMGGLPVWHTCAGLCLLAAVKWAASLRAPCYNHSAAREEGPGRGAGKGEARGEQPCAGMPGGGWDAEALLERVTNMAGERRRCGGWCVLLALGALALQDARCARPAASSMLHPLAWQLASAGNSNSP